MPTEPKPLLIHGDRLLLALDVLAYAARFCRLDCPKIAQREAELRGVETINPRRCSRERVLAVLTARCSFTLSPCPRAPRHDGYCVIHHCDHPADAFENGFPGLLRQFLRDQRDSGVLSEQRFALAPWPIGRMAEAAGIGTATTQLLRLIASGELTEVDFKRED